MGDDDGGYVGGSSQAYAAFSQSKKGGGGRRSPSAMSRGSSLDRDDAMSLGSGRGFGPGREGGRVLRIKRLVSLLLSTSPDARRVNHLLSPLSFAGQERVGHRNRPRHQHHQRLRPKTPAHRGEGDCRRGRRAHRRRREGQEDEEAVRPCRDVGSSSLFLRRANIPSFRSRPVRSLEEEIEKLKKNQSRRLNRKKTMAGDENGVVKPVTSVSPRFTLLSAPFFISR